MFLKRHNIRLRQITITIQYNTSQNLKVKKTYVMSAYISQYR